MIKQKGLLFILSGPSGVGKGTVRKEIFARKPDLKYSISMTTRERRKGEREGIDYYYKTREEFETLIKQNKLLEYAEYVNNYYGTPREFVEKQLTDGYDVFLEIEVQGALQVKKNFPEGVFIFLLPPSLEELKNRIMHRGTESLELVRNRLNEAKNEINMMDAYDYVVVNDDVRHAASKVQSIIQSEHLKRERVAYQYKKLLEVE
ncbi:guanylate kinase [Cerasibacillus terrae]|uniref:Guanylate kinase n=1 Tax=Cerasibacillus terrae TaxID=2498845 RepID=A0A5C8P207_9BACI|nr:guanylate kinase [Cerasibacillus terrae]TXL67629.1 guanylate kinase [Cerasibacillus terrae]